MSEENKKKVYCCPHCGKPIVIWASSISFGVNEFGVEIPEEMKKHE